MRVEPRVTFARRQIVREEAEITATLDEATAVDLVALVCLAARLYPKGRATLARLDALGAVVLDALEQAGVDVPDPEQRFNGLTLDAQQPSAATPIVVHAPVAADGGSGLEPRAGITPVFR